MLCLLGATLLSLLLALRHMQLPELMIPTVVAIE